MKQDTLAQVGKDGELKRKEAVFRHKIAPGSEFEAESTLSRCCVREQRGPVEAVCAVVAVSALTGRGSCPSESQVPMRHNIHSVHCHIQST